MLLIGITSFRSASEVCFGFPEVPFDPAYNLLTFGINQDVNPGIPGTLGSKTGHFTSYLLQMHQTELHASSCCSQ